MSPPAPWVLALAGPTASGKSTLAMALARRSGAELVSADSVQVYRGLDIGSAKPTPSDRAEIPHHGLDLFDPTERSDAWRWAVAAAEAIGAVRARGRPVIIVGGTGLYFRALFVGLSEIPPVPDEVRAAVAARLEAEGSAALHAELTRHDPRTAAAIAQGDRQRVARALEVLLATGSPLSAWHALPPRPAAEGIVRPGEAKFVTLSPLKSTHRATLEARAEAMLDAGLEAEVESLLASGVPPASPGLQSLGYRAVTDAILGGGVPRARLREAIVTGHARYAKRQRTWFEGSAGAELGWRKLTPDATLAELEAMVDRAGP